MADSKPPRKDDEITLNNMRTRIIEAASNLYEKKGRQATVEELAAAAGISVPVTYQYIKNPADIMLLIMETIQTLFSDGLSAKAPETTSPEVKLLAAIRAHFQVVDEHRSKVMLVYRESRTLGRDGLKRIMELELMGHETFKKILDEGVAAGVFRVMDTGVAAYDIIMLSHTWALKNWYFRKAGLDFAGYLSRQESLIMAMVKK